MTRVDLAVRLGLCFGTYWHRSVQDPDFVVFARVKNKFHAVHHLPFSLGSKPNLPDGTCDVALCEAFRSVRCLRINANDMDIIFARHQQGWPRRTMDNCHTRQQVTIWCTDSIWT